MVQLVYTQHGEYDYSSGDSGMSESDFETWYMVPPDLSPGSDPDINYLVVSVGFSDPADNVKMAHLYYDGVEMTPITAVNDQVGQANKYRRQLWVLKNPPAGTKKLSFKNLADKYVGWTTWQASFFKGVDTTAGTNGMGAVVQAATNSGDNWQDRADITMTVTKNDSGIYWSTYIYAVLVDATEWATLTKPTGFGDHDQIGPVFTGGGDTSSLHRLWLPATGSTGSKTYSLINPSGTEYPLTSYAFELFSLAPPPPDPQGITGANVTLTMAIGSGIILVNQNITGAGLSMGISYGDNGEITLGTIPEFQAITGANIDMALAFGTATVSTAWLLIGANIPMSFVLGSGALSYRQLLTGANINLDFIYGDATSQTAKLITGAPIPMNIKMGTAGLTLWPKFPLRVAPGQTRTFSVAFLPQAIGQRTGSISIHSNAAGAPHTINLMGTGLGSGPQNLVGTSVSMAIAVATNGTIAITAPQALTWLTADGTKLRDENGHQVMLRSINWYGLEQAYIPGGSWTRPYKTVTVDGVVQEGMMDEMKRLGFNSIRILVNQDIPKTGVSMNTPTGLGALYCNPMMNPDLFNNPNNLPAWQLTVQPQPVKTAIQILDLMVAHAKSLGMRIVLDMHTFAADNDNNLATDGKWYSTDHPGDTGSTSLMMRSPRSEEQAIVAWETYAERYKNEPTVCGFDLINEPWACTWDAGSTNPDTNIAAYYERAINRIHVINPNLMIICEGITGNVNHCPPGLEGGYENTNGYYDWGTVWSAKLDVVRDRPLVLNTPNKLMFSPHEYGVHTLGGSLPGGVDHQWFNPAAQMPFYGGQPFPENMFEVWRRQWGWMAEEDMYPLWIGEFGTTFTVGGKDWFVIGSDGSVSHNIFEPGYDAQDLAYDTAWLQKLSEYCNLHSIGFAFWSWNPGTVGGIVEMDWKTVIENKYAALKDSFVWPGTHFWDPVNIGDAQEITGANVNMGLAVTTSAVVSNAAIRSYLFANGGRLVDDTDATVILKSIHWFSLEQNACLRGTSIVPLLTRKILQNEDIWNDGKTWADAYEREGVLNMIKRMGFNSLRVPVSLDTVRNDTVYSDGQQMISPYVNPEFIKGTVYDAVTGEPSWPDMVGSPEWGTYPHNPPYYYGGTLVQPAIGGLNYLDLIIDGCEKLGIRVILDMHCLAHDTNNETTTQGKWYTTANRLTGGTNGTGDYNSGERRDETQLLAAWTTLAARYAGRPTVCAIDVINEPYAASWEAGNVYLDMNIRAFYERAGNAIHAVNPDMFLWFEGVHTAYHDGSGNYQRFNSPIPPTGILAGKDVGVGFAEDLVRVRTAPVNLTILHKHGYSSHEYGPSWNTSVGDKVKALATSMSLTEKQVYDARRDYLYGYLAKENIAPLWIGEWGSLFFNNRTSNAALGMTLEKEARDTDWVNGLAAYCAANHISHTAYCLNPGADDLGGLGHATGGDYYGYTGIDTAKMAKIAPMMTY